MSKRVNPSINALSTIVILLITPVSYTHLNLLKLDMLGHDDPTMIRMLENLTGVNALSLIHI